MTGSKKSLIIKIPVILVLQSPDTDNRGITTGGPSIVPFYFREKSAVMQNSTMQDTVCRGILNGTMQGF